MPHTVHVQPGAAYAAQPESATELREAARLVTRAVRAALRQRGVAHAELSVALLADAEIDALNRQYLGHAGPTDVISFALYETGETPVGDIYIGYEQVLRQAAAAGLLPPEELVRVAVHGVLHVLGEDHPPGAARLRSRMWRLQEEIVEQVLAS